MNVCQFESRIREIFCSAAKYKVCSADMHLNGRPEASVQALGELPSWFTVQKQKYIGNDINNISV